MILIHSHAEDLHTRQVVQHLAGLGVETLLFDSGRFPDPLGLTLSTKRGRGFAATLHDPNAGDVDLRRVRSAWWRRPQPLAVSPVVRDPENRRFALNEATEALAGLWEILDVFWINPPSRDAAAHRKLFQLQLAEQVGLRYPRTVVTSDADEAREFIGVNAPAPTVYKAFSATPARWRETRVVRPEELGQLTTVRHCPVIFQEFIPAERDLRVTIVGPDLFVGEIHPAEGGYAYDYRMDLERCCISPGKLTPQTENRLRRLMEHLGLVYGAIDLRRTPEGEEVFLEINPAGQWLFVEERTGQPITAALASLLASGAARGSTSRRNLRASMLGGGRTAGIERRSRRASS